MPAKLKLRQAVVVEGKYDKIRLEAVVDALILTTDGFRIYKDKERQALFRSLAASRGLIVLTDPDRAGFQLRGFLSGSIPPEQITHVFIPDFYGKEKRKRQPSAEGKLGVEGVSGDTLREAFAKAGIREDDAPPPADPITREDFYSDGLMGGVGSAELRRALYRELGLPERMNTTSALVMLNHMLDKPGYRAVLEKLRGQG